MIAKTFDELFRFYHDYVKKLYATSQVEDTQSIETLLEIHSAFDHCSRHWTASEPEAECAARAFGHLKRSCLDTFKLQVKRGVQQYHELRQCPVHLVDNGDFLRQLDQLFYAVRTASAEARTQEGVLKSTGNPSAVFSQWEAVAMQCQRINDEFYMSPKVDWAKRADARQKLRSFAWWLIGSFILGGIVCNIIATVVVKWMGW